MNVVERSNDGVVLRKCPFCGGEARIEAESIGKEKYLYSVSCINDCVTQGIYHKTVDSAIKAWNTRTPVENAIGQIEEIKNAFQEGYYTKFYCSNRLDKCVGKDCVACVLEKAIEIIKEELM